MFGENSAEKIWKVGTHHAIFVSAKAVSWSLKLPTMLTNKSYQVQEYTPGTIAGYLVMNPTKLIPFRSEKEAFTYFNGYSSSRFMAVLMTCEDSAGNELCDELANNLH